MEKQTFEEIIQQSSQTEHLEKDYYSDVALKILLRTMTPVTVSASFEQSVLNKVALLEPTKLYNSFIAATSFYAIISFMLISFSSLINYEILSTRSSKSKEQITIPKESQEFNVEINSSSSLPNSSKKQMVTEETVVSKKKSLRRKNTNTSTQRPVPPPPKGIE